MLGIVAVGVVRSPENFQGTHAHCAVIIAIAQLSCFITFEVTKKANPCDACETMLVYVIENVKIYRLSHFKFSGKSAYCHVWK